MMAKAKPKKKSRKSTGSSNNKRLNKLSSSSKPSLNSLLKDVKANPDDIKARLLLGEYYLHQNLEQKIVEVVEPLEKQYPFSDVMANRIYSRLLSLGYAHLNRLLDAEKTCTRGMEEEPDALDYYFVMSFIHLSLREYDKVITFCNNFISHYKKKSKDSTLDYSCTDNHLSQIYNFLGTVHFEKAEWDEARKCFEMSKKADPGNHLPYINQANIARHHNNLDEALKIINEGITKCRQVQELRILANSLKNSQTVSACMIVKNEQKHLPDCLDSIRNWVDEIIIVDTGSTDKTVEIAKSYGAKLFHQEWEDNFSKHRNYSLEQAAGDWIFIIDADERIYEQDVPQIKRLINQDDVGIISINVFNVYGEREELTTFLPSVRFWRRKIGLRYEGIVHNLLRLGEEHPVTRTNIRLKHLGYDLSEEEMKKKFHRTKTLLEKQLEENPDDAFALFNYAQVLKSEGKEYPLKNIPLIIKSAQRAVQITDPAKKDERHIHLMCLDQIAWANFYAHKYDIAFEYCQRALKLKPDYLDPLMLLGHLYSERKDWDNARRAFHNYLDTQAKYNLGTETDCLILTHVDNRSSAYYGLALIAETHGDIDKAKLYYQQTLKAQNNFLEANYRLASIFYRENNLNDAEKYFLNQLNLSSKTVDAALGLAVVYQRKKQNKKADEYFQEAMKIDTFNPSPRIKYGYFLLENGREKEAMDYFKEGQELGKDSPNILMELADIYVKYKKFDEAVKVYTNLLDEHGKTSELLNNLANCYFKMKQYNDAESYYQQALDTDNPLGITYRNLGLTRARLNMPREAIITLEKYLKLAEEDLDIIQIIGDLYIKLGEYNSALNYFEIILGSEPEDFQTLLKLSDCYLNMGHRDSAILGYQRVLALQPDFEPARQRLNQLQKHLASDIKN